MEHVLGSTLYALKRKPAPLPLQQAASTAAPRPPLVWTASRECGMASRAQRYPAKTAAPRSAYCLGARHK